MAEQGAADAVGEGGARAAFGIWTVACAVLATPGAAADERALAEAVLRAAHDPDAPAEQGTIAAIWNRDMDVLINAANASHGERHRPVRRAKMAQALEQARLLVVPAETVADLVEEIERLKRPLLTYDFDTGAAYPASACPPPSCASAAECAAAGGADHREYVEPENRQGCSNVND